MKNLILCLSGIFVILSCQTQQTEQKDLTLQEYFDSSSIPAAVMGSIDDKGNIDWHDFGPQIWGDSTTTVGKDHIFRIYSMTKPIASVAAMQLVEKGLIGLDDPLNELMPEMVSIPILGENGNLYHSDQIITLRQLLTHTSGFASKQSPALAKFKQPDDWEYEDVPRIFEPGTDWHYGTSLDWAGKVIEKISGQNLEAYLRENITGPLQMNSTWFNIPEELKENIVSWGGKDSTGTIIEWTRIPESPVSFYSAGAGLSGSPNDYLKFLQCMLNYGEYDGGKILKRETVEIMLENNLPVNVHASSRISENDDFGIGWAIKANENDSFLPVGSVYWGGWANTYFSLDAKNKIAIIYFSNFVPAIDEEAFGFFELFGEEVYSKN